MITASPPSPGQSGGKHGAALVVALDVPTADRALELAEALSGLPLWVKVGLELFTAEGPTLTRRLLDMGLPVFLDLKFHDIPNTVAGALVSATRLGVGMITVHMAGGEAMCRAAAEGRATALAGRESGPGGPLLMGVTVLTSQGGDAEVIRRLVVERALLARACGLDGVVCSGWEAAAVKAACGEDFLCLCPGIRFAEAGGAGRGDQARVCTPAQAVAAGADFLVMGRPITKAADPAAAARRALEEMSPSAS
jgi:orotidine-5'-phosphate decarboxylase